MRPGPHPWAENDSYVAGPDIGSGTKTAPLAVHKEDGYYRSRRPAPGIFNWQLNRSALSHEVAARLQVLNWSLVVTDTTDYNGGNLLASCHQNSSGAPRPFLFYHDPVAGTVKELMGSNTGTYWTTPASSPVDAGPIAACVVDADGDSAGRRIVTIDDGAVTDRVRYAASTAGGSWTAVTFTAGAPTLAWRAVGCDRGSTGAADSWLIGDDAGGGNPAVWGSSDGINFAVRAGFPGATLAEAIRGIFHTCHHAGALGPDDAGNTSWLVMSDTYATYSADGTTFTAVAHGLAPSAAMSRRCAAYSRPSRRWVCVVPTAAGFSIAQSSDNGATWAVTSSVATDASAEWQIVGDGYGSFVVMQNDGGSVGVYVSTDEGDSWTYVIPSATHSGVAAGGLDGYALECVTDENLDVDENSVRPAYFLLAAYDDATPDTEIFRSLLI